MIIVLTWLLWVWLLWSPVIIYSVLSRWKPSLQKFANLLVSSYLSLMLVGFLILAGRYVTAALLAVAASVILVRIGRAINKPGETSSE